MQAHLVFYYTCYSFHTGMIIKYIFMCICVQVCIYELVSYNYKYFTSLIRQHDIISNDPLEPHSESGDTNDVTFMFIRQ